MIKTERKPGEDPANFGITLETLAVKAFGDIGQTARLRLIRDRFIAGHGSCELRRHLDCLPPDTPLRDMVDRCRVWESHSDLAARNVNQPKLTYPAYAVKPLEKEPEAVRAITVNKPERPVENTNELIKKLVDMLTPGANTTMKAPEPSPSTSWSEVKCFSCGNSGHSAARCPTLDITFPFILPGWKAEKTSVGYMMISPRRAMDRRQAENPN